MPKVSGHSGLPESVELRQMAEKAEQMAEKRRKQLSAIYSVLDHMTKEERGRILLEVIRHYRARRWSGGFSVRHSSCGVLLTN